MTRQVLRPFLSRPGSPPSLVQSPPAFPALGDGQALFWEFTITHPGPSIINPEYYRAEHPARPKGAAGLRLRVGENRSYQLLAYRVGFRSNDVQSAWRDLGSPAQLTRAQVAGLRQASSGAPVIDEKVIVGADGRFDRSFPLRENDVWLVQLRPR